MSQSLLIIFKDEHGRKSRVHFSQTDQDAVTKMDVQDLAPDELVKLMMLLNQLSMQTIENMATAQNDAKSEPVPTVARTLN